ncbi:MarR family winged helix-turn-helix transcriptional regulator [Ideonella livida]|uniref:MarR family transcriptional regulator n=1 Tax=Ideonella livida TaxID=2707176 RepID=A0A7C9PJK7_9BURK|nr:MarR family transcriptional regulator [Ideonella livida]NDY93657.1 MarR family transcriptional regulator [Ideonella livida]
MPARKPLSPDDTTPEAPLHEGALGPVIGYQLAQATIVTSQVFAATAGRGLDLRPVEFTLLTLIAENPGVSARQLSRALAVTPPNITMWVDKLSERGLVTRERSATDGRAQHLSTTPAGTELARQAVRALREAERETLARGLSAAEQAILAELLHKLARCRRKGN